MEVYKEIKKDIFWIIITAFILNAIFNALEIGYDSTDGDTRSGLILYTDNLTGCQYLSSSNGQLIKRFNSDGNHICEVIR